MMACESCADGARGSHLVRLARGHLSAITSRCQAAFASCLREARSRRLDGPLHCPAHLPAGQITLSLRVRPLPSAAAAGLPPFHIVARVHEPDFGWNRRVAACRQGQRLVTTLRLSSRSHASLRRPVPFVEPLTARGDLPHTAAWAAAKGALKRVLSNLASARPWAEERRCGSAGEGGAAVACGERQEPKAADYPCSDCGPTECCRPAHSVGLHRASH